MSEDNIIHGWAAPFGGPQAGNDLHGQRFTAKTDFAENWYTERPLLYEHGLDPTVGDTLIGRVIQHRVDDRGLWVKAQLDIRSVYYEWIRELIDRGALSFSSGALARLIQVENGQILKWPWLETSLTTTPANPAALVWRPTSSARAAEVGELATIKRALEIAEVETIRDEILAAQRAVDMRRTYGEFLRLEARMLGVPVS